MRANTSTLVPGIRAVSRDLVRVWGFLNRKVAGTDMSGSAVHAIIEIGASPGLTATDLCARLHLEKSTISRLVRMLIERGEIEEAASPHDARAKTLHLSSQGKRTLASVNSLADAQVSDALGRLDDDTQRIVLQGMRSYSCALQSISSFVPEPASVQIHRGYVPGLVGRVTELIATYIQTIYPFGRGFEARIARDMSEFVMRADAAPNGIWYARSGERIVGSVTIDGENLGDGCAHLRWFILSEELHGAGIGRRLLQCALTHCDDVGFKETHLWTVKGLDAARRLYERNGFTLVDEYQGDQWSAPVTEQRFVRPMH